MGRLDDMVAADAAIFIDPDASPEVELVAFTPSRLAAVQLYVQVFRDAPMNLGDGQIAGRVLKIFVRRHETLGRLTIDASGDQVEIAFEKNTPPERKRVASIESEDAGGFMLILE